MSLWVLLVRLCLEPHFPNLPDLQSIRPWCQPWLYIGITWSSFKSPHAWVPYPVALILMVWDEAWASGILILPGDFNAQRSLRTIDPGAEMPSPPAIPTESKRWGQDQGIWVLEEVPLWSGKSGTGKNLTFLFPCRLRPLAVPVVEEQSS